MNMSFHWYLCSLFDTCCTSGENKSTTGCEKKNIVDADKATVCFFSTEIGLLCFLFPTTLESHWWNLILYTLSLRFFNMSFLGWLPFLELFCLCIFGGIHSHNSIGLPFILFGVTWTGQSRIWGLFGIRSLFMWCVLGLGSNSRPNRCFSLRTDRRFRRFIFRVTNATCTLVLVITLLRDCNKCGW